MEMQQKWFSDLPIRSVVQLLVMTGGARRGRHITERHRAWARAQTPHDTSCTALSRATERHRARARAQTPHDTSCTALSTGTGLSRRCKLAPSMMRFPCTASDNGHDTRIAPPQYSEASGAAGPATSKPLTGYRTLFGGKVFRNVWRKMNITRWELR